MTIIYYEEYERCGNGDEINTFSFYFYFQAVFERLVDIICDKMSESLDSDPTLVASGSKGQRLSDPPQAGPNANCNC